MKIDNLRVRYVLYILATVAVGLTVHLFGFGLPAPVRDVLGDALWAVMIFWLVSLVAPRRGRLPRGAAALAICFAVELSQRLEHPVLDAIRSAPFGHLVLGTDFDARDLLAYTAGVAAAVLSSPRRT